MENISEFLFTSGGIFIVVLVILLNIIQRPGRYRKQITKALEAKGHSLLSIKAAKPFQTGPFPKFEIRIQPMQSAGSREKTTYGIVTYKTESGEIMESWVRINVEGFRVMSIEWKPEL